MIDRRSRPRWTQAERYLPPVKLSLRLPLLIGVLAIVVFNVQAPPGSASRVGELTDTRLSGSAVAAPCPRLISFYRVEPAIVDWCIRYPYTGM